MRTFLFFLAMPFLSAVGPEDPTHHEAERATPTASTNAKEEATWRDTLWQAAASIPSSNDVVEKTSQFTNAAYDTTAYYFGATSEALTQSLTIEQVQTVTSGIQTATDGVTTGINVLNSWIGSYWGTEPTDSDTTLTTGNDTSENITINAPPTSKDLAI